MGVEIGMYPVADNGETGFHFCVDGATKLITKDGVTNIKDAVGKDVEIWNGDAWSEVSPYKTGDADRLHRVNFSDGSHLDATDNHKFLVKTRFQKDFREVETLDLIEELKASKYGLQIPRSNIECVGGESQPDAYDYGFILGDGHIGHDKYVYGHIYVADKMLNFKTASPQGDHGEGAEYKVFRFMVDLDFSKALKHGHGLPSTLFSWDKESILDFIAGWADADGSQASKGVRIYGREDKIRDGQLLLSKVGINSSVNLMSEKGTFTNYCERKNDVWYLQITKTDEIPCQRLVCNNTEGASHKGKYQIVRSVETLEGLHESFCLTEPENNQCVFNNVLTKQCNLSEINGGRCEDKESFLRAAKAGSIMGTLQAGYTGFTYLSEATRNITEREALIGVSITGWMNNPGVLFDKDNMIEGAKLVKEVNKRTAKLLGINPAARTCCVKPSGNASVLLGTASGIHGEHSPLYFRNVQMNEQDEVLDLIAKTNSKMVESSVWSANGTDKVVAFPVESPEGSVYKDSLMGVKQLEYVKLAQQYWVEYGTDESLCIDKRLRHNVSNTITVDDWDEVEQYLFDNRQWFAGVSLLSAMGDKAYPQAPFTEVFTAEQIMQKYGDASLFASGLIVDGLHAFNRNLWGACEALLGYGEDLSEETSDNALKRDWVRRANKYAKNYFASDQGEMTNCLKDCYNFHKWKTINRKLQSVDFTKEMLKKKFTNVDTMGAVACSGTQCEVSF